MFKAREGGFKAISISVELFLSNFREKTFDKPWLQRGENLILCVITTGLEKVEAVMRSKTKKQRGPRFGRIFGTGEIHFCFS